MQLCLGTQIAGIRESLPAMLADGLCSTHQVIPVLHAEMSPKLLMKEPSFGTSEVVVKAN